MLCPAKMLLLGWDFVGRGTVGRQPRVVVAPVGAGTGAFGRSAAGAPSFEQLRATGYEEQCAQHYYYYS